MNEIFNPFWGGKQAVHSTIRAKRSIIVNQRRSVLTQLTWLVGYLPYPWPLGGWLTVIRFPEDQGMLSKPDSDPSKCA